jgi:hypothetical protein
LQTVVSGKKTAFMTGGLILPLSGEPFSNYHSSPRDYLPLDWQSGPENIQGLVWAPAHDRCFRAGLQALDGSADEG